MRYAGETACATNGKSFACIGGTGFSLSTPACGRTFSHLLMRERLPAPYLSRQAGGHCSRHLDQADGAPSSGERHFRKAPESARDDQTAGMVDPPLAAGAYGCRRRGALGREGVARWTPRPARAIGEGHARVLHPPGLVVMQQRSEEHT